MGLFHDDHKVSVERGDERPPSTIANASKAQEGSVSAARAEDHEMHYLTGLPLWAVTTGISLVVMLIFLDISIIVTVGTTPVPWRASADIPGYPGNHNLLQLPSRRWMVWCCVPARQVRLPATESRVYKAKFLQRGPSASDGQAVHPLWIEMALHILHACL